jgi:hypothetical protein
LWQIDPDGLPTERELHFVADKMISAYAEEAREQHSIVAYGDFAGGFVGSWPAFNCLSLSSMAGLFGHNFKLAL